MPTIKMKYSLNENSKLSDRDKKISDYIGANEGEDYSAVLARDGDWDLFHQLAKTRESILNWYNFAENANVLEIGSGYGAVTGLLCDRCKTVTCVETQPYKAEALAKRYKNRTNMDIYVGNVVDLKFEIKFDYIIMLGILEYQGNGSKGKDRYIAFIRSIKELLNDKGKILLATENRYGIRYFCGEKEPFSHIPFYGINRYPKGCAAYAFDKRELTDIVNESGLHFKFYYPVPDYKHTQMIFTDEYLPKSSLRERIVPYYNDKSTLVALEKDLYDDLVANNVFPFFSNSFLLECGLDDHFSDVVSAALSTDRGSEHGFATVISKKKVEKRALDKKGCQSLKTISSNMLDLEKHGINIVPHDLEAMKLSMPFIDQKTLSDVLREALRNDPDKFIGMFDLLYEQILQSSEHVEKKYNALRKNPDDTSNYGIILKKAYIDMIPINCFYDEGKLIFFDQEFVRENFPASYTMFRALKYTYSFITFANGIVPLRQMKERFGLIEVWEDYVLEENEFVRKNRDFKTYGSFWERANVNKNDIISKISFE
ncbi:class I SAM-dependent methyltransferase [Desulfitobacterium hafniense]|uniref:class I SAM-dependent methyltransferase n=1 Tax=Desulfitobacterium hafniense TaxID=49338 RepID=UPI0003716C3B|nr:methyltransferase domain-containing protein [Desulfitobacterium hafniense]